jgi:hypothetical protein
MNAINIKLGKLNFYDIYSKIAKQGAIFLEVMPLFKEEYLQKLVIDSHCLYQRNLSYNDC